MTHDELVFHANIPYPTKDIRIRCCFINFKLVRRYKVGSTKFRITLCIIYPGEDHECVNHSKVLCFVIWIVSIISLLRWAHFSIGPFSGHLRLYPRLCRCIMISCRRHSHNGWLTLNTSVIIITILPLSRVYNARLCMDW